MRKDAMLRGTLLHDTHAVSPVITVILMVSITVVMGAILFVLSQDFSDPDHDSENAAARLTSPGSGIIHITLIKDGDKAPYVTTDGAFNEYTVSIDGVPCDDSELPASVRSGNVIRLDAAVVGTCQDIIVPGGDHTVIFTAAKTIILSAAVDVTA